MADLGSFHVFRIPGQAQGLPGLAVVSWGVFTVASSDLEELFLSVTAGFCSFPCLTFSILRDHHVCSREGNPPMFSCHFDGFISLL